MSGEKAPAWQTENGLAATLERRYVPFVTIKKLIGQGVFAGSPKAASVTASPDQESGGVSPQAN